LGEYRQGNYSGALASIQRVLEPGGNACPDHLQVEAYATSAMAHHRLEKVEQARSDLARANQIAQTALPPQGSDDFGAYWNEMIIAHTLMSEAKAVLEAQPAPGAKALNHRN